MARYAPARLALVSVLSFVISVSAVLPASAQTSSWSSASVIEPGSKVQVELYDTRVVKGRAVSITPELIVVAVRDGERRVPRTEVRRLRVPSIPKRILFGALGVFTGALIPVLACPYCENEGHSIDKQVQIGAAVGALVFLIPQTSTVYKGPKR